ncbi:DapH/DapD/GlmU-related protein [Nocardioides pakistanensis]
MLRSAGLMLLRMIAPLARPIFRAFFDPRIVPAGSDRASMGRYRQLVTALWRQRILGFNRHCPWPIATSTIISDFSKLHFHPNDVRNLSSHGCYFQNFSADIFLGEGTFIAPNVGLITANHDPSDLNNHLPGHPITLGKKCWVGMNSVILPGVTLGDGTIVAAGSVVTKSFPVGSCVIGGNPARILKRL